MLNHKPLFASIALLAVIFVAQDISLAQAPSLVQKYCLDCHDARSKEGGLDLEAFLSGESFDATLVFENVITHRMPPADGDQPTADERRTLLSWLAQQSKKRDIAEYRRLSRYEFVHSINDLLGTELDIAGQIPEDRGTYGFDTDRRIMISSEQLSAYFLTADQMLEFALPRNGFPQERLWTTNSIKDSHETYNIYVRDYQQGLLYSWTRANNGNSYSYFYDHFEPPSQGMYELTFDASIVGDFPGDVSILVYAGKYYYADDRPQPQRLLGVLSVGNAEVKPFTLEAFLYPGENVSVHCYSRHTWRQQGANQGAYIEQLKIRGPILNRWPPESIHRNFKGLALDTPPRTTHPIQLEPTQIERIGGSVSVSSFQVGMEMERMLDRSSKTFWHTRFTPDVAEPPHFVIIENPNHHSIAGLSYSTWTGGNGNGQVKAYEVSESDDAKVWSLPIASGTLEVMHAAEQEVRFDTHTQKRFIRFLVTDSVMLDGKSLASIGGLDVIPSDPPETNPLEAPLRLAVQSDSVDDLQGVIRDFAQRAFASKLSEEELEPYFRVGLDAWQSHSDFLLAARSAFKSILCSHRFLLAPGIHSNRSYEIAANLSRILWLSVPDEQFQQIAKQDRLDAATIRTQIDRMLEDPRSKRMIHSLCDQWLNLRGFNKVSPSLKLYPEYNDLLNHYLPMETQEYLYHAIRENLAVTSLIDSDFSYLNQRLAEHYGIDGIVGQDLRRVALPADSPRGGLLTMGSILKVTSDGFQTSPILRGAWISKNIAGNTLSPPPPNIKAIEPSPHKATTLKEQIQEHKSSDACYACHKSIDPYGFALENFDATGHWRTMYRSEIPHQGTFSYRLEGQFRETTAVDASGEISGVAFEDIAGLKKSLESNHKKIAYNFSRKFFEYASGYEPTLSQRIALYDLIDDRPENCRLKDLVTGILIYLSLGDHP
ncbi:MAG: DUF1592 domain-containing protein [Planctomycetota bacterium]